MNSRAQLFVKIGIIFVLIIGFAFYGFYKARDFLKGPKIFIESPREGVVISSSYTEIKGTVKNVSTVYFNGRQIFTDEKGFFKEALLLARGYNIIEVSAQDKFGRKVKEQREVVLK